MSNTATQLVWAKILVHAWSNKGFKDKLEEDPKAALSLLPDGLREEAEGYEFLFSLPDLSSPPTGEYIPHIEWTKLLIKAAEDDTGELRENLQKDPRKTIANHSDPEISKLLVNYNKVFRVPASPAEYLAKTDTGKEPAMPFDQLTSPHGQNVCFCCFIPGWVGTDDDMRG